MRDNHQCIRKFYQLNLIRSADLSSHNHGAGFQSHNEAETWSARQKYPKCNNHKCTDYQFYLTIT